MNTYVVLQFQICCFLLQVRQYYKCMLHGRNQPLLEYVPDVKEIQVLTIPNFYIHWTFYFMVCPRFIYYAPQNQQRNSTCECDRKHIANKFLNSKSFWEWKCAACHEIYIDTCSLFLSNCKFYNPYYNRYYHSTCSILIGMQSTHVSTQKYSRLR